ncbi:MAG: hypothetical protein IT376_20010 [Polyangiaceae bacterium]|nr:hypothetical protein [Polyangiaceae bacterium]
MLRVAKGAAWLHQEARLAEHLKAQGNRVTKLTESEAKGGDVLLNRSSRPVEFKTLRAARYESFRNRLREASKQARLAVVDVRGIHVTEQDVRGWVGRLPEHDRTRFDFLRVVGQDFDLTW